MTATRRKERLKSRGESVDPHAHQAPSFTLDVDDSHTTGRRDTDRPTCLTPINHVCVYVCESAYVHLSVPLCALVCVCVCKSASWPNWWLITLSFPVKEVYKSSGGHVGLLHDFKHCLTAPLTAT